MGSRSEVKLLYLARMHTSAVKTGGRIIPHEKAITEIRGSTPLLEFHD
jgi:hypothetical protein